MVYFRYLLYSIVFVYACSFLFGKSKKLFFFAISGVLLTLFLGFRDIYSGGIDLLRYDATYDYLLHADSMRAASEIREGENILFFLSMFISAKLGWSFQFFLLIVAALSVSASLLLYYRYSKYPLLSICIFLPTCYIHLFSQLKQTIAVAIAVYAYMLFRKDKMYPTYALLAIAALFHPTAIVMIPFFILSKYRANPLLLASLFIGSLFVYLLRMEIGYFLTIAFYEQHLNNLESRESMTGMAVLFILITISYLFFMPKSREVSKEKYLTISSSLYVLIIAMTIFFCSSYSYAFTRLNNYFMVFIPLVLSEMTEFNLWKSIFRSKIIVNTMFGMIMFVMINWFFGMVVSQRLDLYKFYWTDRYENNNSYSDIQQDEEP